MKTIIHALKISEISAVDRPAQSHAKAVIMKRAGDVAHHPEEITMSRQEVLKAFSKDYGAPKIAKHIVDHGNGPDGTALTEAEFTEILMDHARLSKRDRETAAQAFARIFSDMSPEGVQLRKAHAIVKGLAIIEPRQVGGRDATAVDNPTGALAQLQKLAEEQRQRNPALTLDQAFARVYSDPLNRELAARERQENRPRAI